MGAYRILNVELTSKSAACVQQIYCKRTNVQLIEQMEFDFYRGRAATLSLLRAASFTAEGGAQFGLDATAT